MKNLVVRNVKSSRTYRYYNTVVKILKGVAGAYMFVVGGALRLVFNHKAAVLCGIASAYAVQYAM